MWSFRKLACGLEAVVGTLIERSAAGHFQLAVVEADIAGHERFLRVHKAYSRSILKGVVEELGAVRFLDLDALEASDDSVLLEYVVLGSPGIADFGCVGP